MATASSLKNQLAKKELVGQASAIANSVKGLMDSPAVKKRKFYVKEHLNI